MRKGEHAHICRFGNIGGQFWANMVILDVVKNLGAVCHAGLLRAIGERFDDARGKQFAHQQV